MGFKKSMEIWISLVGHLNSLWLMAGFITCCQTLAVAGDERARPMLVTAYQIVQSGWKPGRRD
jgi:hypothetical protein